MLLVCTANHCRSPLAEVMLRRAIDRRGLESKVTVESAALRQLKVGEPPSSAMIAVASRRGLELAGRATWASPERVAAADLVVCMDHDQAQELARDVALAPASDPSRSASDRIRLLLEFAPDCGREEVPDPYGRDAFAHEQVADLIERGAEGLAEAIAGGFEPHR
ncbi:MAG: low molecular weight phosphotyrosine protein phosphatase [Phycisphaerales bacterium]